MNIGKWLLGSSHLVQMEGLHGRAVGGNHFGRRTQGHISKLGLGPRRARCDAHSATTRIPPANTWAGAKPRTGAGTASRLALSPGARMPPTHASPSQALHHSLW